MLFNYRKIYQIKKTWKVLYWIVLILSGENSFIFYNRDKKKYYILYEN